ncbi:MAG: PQQ-like beta-propeller repeat protein [Planctomycetota bacterium]|nr:PQQ-like beta-propeller repeat protein [Planctomycetota bacterium]
MSHHRSPALSRPILFAPVVLALSAIGPAQNWDWPQWRGPAGDGISKEGGWDVAGKPEKLWFTNVGIGYSTVSVVGKHIFTMGHDEDLQEDTVFCIDAKTGRDVWTYSYPAKTMARFHGGGSLSTPSVDRGRVFVANREGRLYCLEAGKGKLLWSKDLKEEFDLKIPMWGFAAAPFIIGDMLVMNLGRVLAFDRDGDLLWATKEDYGGSYSTPSLMKIGNRDCLVVFSAGGIEILEVKTGKERDSFSWPRSRVNAATPVTIGNKVFISAGYNRGCAMLEISSKGVEVAWESKAMRNHMSGCVHFEGHLYGFDDSTLKCLDLDGEVKWFQRGFGKGALLVADGKLLIMGRGELIIAEATAEEFRELARSKVLHGGEYWTTPVLSGGRIYCRNSLGDLVCMDHRSSDD